MYICQELQAGNTCHWGSRRLMLQQYRICQVCAFLCMDKGRKYIAAIVQALVAVLHLPAQRFLALRLRLRLLLHMVGTVPILCNLPDWVSLLLTRHALLLGVTAQVSASGCLCSL